MVLLLHDEYNIFFPLEVKSTQCCNEINLLWNPGPMVMDKITFSSPVGKYTQQRVLSHEKAVYYSKETDYFIYNRGTEWVVSILT